jgi:hypothetical protein
MTPQNGGLSLANILDDKDVDLDIPEGAETEEEEEEEEKGHEVPAGLCIECEGASTSCCCCRGWVFRLRWAARWRRRRPSETGSLAPSAEGDLDGVKCPEG